MPTQQLSVLLATVVDTAGLARLPMLLSAVGCAVTLLAPKRLAIARSRFVKRPIVDCQSLQEVVECLRQQIEAEANA